MLKWLHLWESKKDLQKSKKKLVAINDSNLAMVENSISEIAITIRDFKKHNYRKHDAILNLCLFSDIAGIDLTLILEKYRLADRILERKLYARLLSIFIIDYLDNVSVLIGRDCLKELRENIHMKKFEEEFRPVHKKFSAFKTENEKLLREIRNTTIAHRSKEALKLYDSINNLNLENIYQLGLELQIQITELTNVSNKVLFFIGNYLREGKRI